MYESDTMTMTVWIQTDEDEGLSLMETYRRQRKHDHSLPCNKRINERRYKYCVRADEHTLTVPEYAQRQRTSQDSTT